jgi:predicted MFS family arabinose efflux permease
MIASSYSLAAAVSSVIVMFVGKPMGRKRSIQFGTVLIIIGAVLQV